MKITNSNYKFNRQKGGYKSQNFASTRMKQFDELGNVIFCHYTNLNRTDLNWAKFSHFLDDRFAKQEKVKINLFGASDNSDGYTLIMNLIKELGDRAKRFFPIKSSDISEKVIDENMKSKILLHSRDLEYIKKNGMSSMFERDYTEPVQTMQGIEFLPYKVKNELKDKFEFSIQDVRKAASDTDFSDGVFIFRNGWGFNTLQEQEKMAQNLFQNSNNNTLVVLGQSDLYKSGASDALQRSGFKGIESDIFTKAETDYPTNYIGTPKTKPVYPEFILFEKKGIYV